MLHKITHLQTLTGGSRANALAALEVMQSRSAMSEEARRVLAELQRRAERREVVGVQRP